MDEPLQQIGTVELVGRVYDLARNGKFWLVETGEKDAYGREAARKVELEEFFQGMSATFVARFTQGLLDALGDAVVRLKHQRDSRLGNGGEE